MKILRAASLGFSFTGSYKKSVYNKTASLKNLLNVLGVSVNGQHRVKSVHIRSYSGPNAGKYRQE